MDIDYILALTRALLDQTWLYVAVDAVRAVVVHRPPSGVEVMATSALSC